MSNNESKVTILFKNGQRFNGVISTNETENLVGIFRTFLVSKNPTDSILEFPGVHGFGIFNMEDIAGITVED